MTTLYKIAIIGAGMAGASCARQLTDAGHEVTVFDKGRGLGGRLAQRRREGAMFDHGAQYFTARDPEFQGLVTDWLAAGDAALWPLAHRPAEPSYIGVPSMSQPVKALLSGIDTRTGIRLSEISRTASGWLIRDDQGVDYGPFDRLGLAVPQPQAIDLLNSWETTSKLCEQLQNVSIAPCWTCLLGFDQPLAERVENGPLSHPILNWAALNNGKTGRSGIEAWTLHAGHDWSRANLEASPAEILPLMQQAFADLFTDGSFPEPIYAACHRWRYAFVDRPLGLPAIGEPELDLAIMGDWCLGPRVEAAFLSGRAGAAMLAK